MYEDLNHLNSIANRQNGQKKRYGLTLNKKKNFVNQFLALERDAKGNVSTAIDAIDVNSLGIHRALFEGNIEMYKALKENKLRDVQILDYLEGMKPSQSDSSSSFSSSTPCLSSDGSQPPSAQALHLNHADHDGTIKALQNETIEMIKKR